MTHYHTQAGVKSMTMKYSLRSLMIVMLIAPPLLALAWFSIRDWLLVTASVMACAAWWLSW